MAYRFEADKQIGAITIERYQAAGEVLSGKGEINVYTTAPTGWEPAATTQMAVYTLSWDAASPTGKKSTSAIPTRVGGVPVEYFGARLGDPFPSTEAITGGSATIAVKNEPNAVPFQRPGSATEQMVALNLVSGTATPGFGTPSAVVNGNNVRLTGNVINVAKNGSNETVNFATLPANLRPANQMEFAVSGYTNGGGSAMLVVRPTGEMFFRGTGILPVSPNGLEGLGLDNAEWSVVASTTPTPTPTPTTPTVTLSPAIASTAQNTQVTYTLTGFAPNTSVNYQWMKNGQAITTTGGSGTLTTNAQGGLSATFNASVFAAAPFSGAGTYGLAITPPGGTALLSNQLTVDGATPPTPTNSTVTLSPATASIEQNSQVTHTLTGFAPNTSLNYQWLKNGQALTGTGATGTFTTNAQGGLSATFNASVFAAAPFNGAGQYVLSVTPTGAGAAAVNSNPIAVYNRPPLTPGTIAITPSTGSIAANTAMNVNFSGFQPSEQMGLAWLKNGQNVTANPQPVQVNASGQLTIPINAGAFAAAPYNGSGSYLISVYRYAADPSDPNRYANSNTISITA
jgi:hypothetical protein